MQPRPLTYRAEIIGPVLASIAAGECCSIVGMSGVGKSNMLQQLLRPDVLRQYVGAQAEQLRFAIVDTNLLAEYSIWGFFEALSEALLAALGGDLSPEIAGRLGEAHERTLAQAGHDARALRSCTAAIADLCAEWRLVLLFDEFDPLFTQLPVQVLRHLRGLRDRYKYRLMYLTFSRQPLVNLRDEADWEHIEPFVELLTLRELGLKPLRDEDAAGEVASFANRHGLALDAAIQTRIVALSGGHPALLRALTQEALLDDSQLTAPNRLLQHRSALRLECTKIWQQLTGEEQDSLLRARREMITDGPEAQALQLKGLLHAQPQGRLVIFSPLFEAYLATIATPAKDTPEPILVDSVRNVVHYYGRDISTILSPREHRLLAYLWEHRDRICSVAEVAGAVYFEEKPVYAEQQEDDLERLRILARRLRRRLEQLVPNQPVPLTIYRLHGYRLGIHAE